MVRTPTGDPGGRPPHRRPQNQKFPKNAPTGTPSRGVSRAGRRMQRAIPFHRIQSFTTTDFYEGHIDRPAQDAGPLTPSPPPSPRCAATLSPGPPQPVQEGDPPIFPSSVEVFRICSTDELPILEDSSSEDEKVCAANLVNTAEERDADEDVSDFETVFLDQLIQKCKI